MSSEVLQLSQYLPELAFLTIGILGAFTTKQRAWVLRRDGFKCQDPDCHDRVRPDGKGLHVHHILAAGWFKRFFLGLSDDPNEQNENFPENGITLGASCHHNSYIGVHPDYAAALDKYREGDKEAFKKVAKKHGEKERLEEIYWNTEKTVLYDRIAIENTDKWNEEHPNQPFPYE